MVLKLGLARTLFLVAALLGAREALAQDAWEPLGPIPVDQAGAGRRGYVLPGESTDLATPGAPLISLHAVAANDFYREEANGFLITERYEAHTLAFGYRRGFSLGRFPRIELGGQVQLHESDNGILNGFIEHFESGWVALTGSSSAKNQLRSDPASLPALGMSVTRNGALLYQGSGSGAGLGDVYLVASALLRDAPLSSRRARVAARVAVNIAGSSQFTEGTFAGVGVSLDKKVAGWTALHADVRSSVILDRLGPWGLPLKRTAFAFSVGPELKLPGTTSIGLQIDGSTTPYQPTGTAGLDKGYGDVTLGLAHRFTARQRRVMAQIYARENMNLPFSIRWNTDPDFSLGLKITVR